MSVGVITGSGAYSLPGLAEVECRTVTTPYGQVPVRCGQLGGVEVLHIARHGDHHQLLSNVVNHRANIWALRELGAGAVLGTTACGAVDPTLGLGSLVVFDDLYFLSNRLGDGSICTFFDQPGDPERAHWILHGGPYSHALVRLVGAAALAVDVDCQVGGVYGHVDGPRFNTPAEIASLGAIGVAAVSQTGGPETVLCGELELPFVLVGFVTDYANEVMPGEPTPVKTLFALVAQAPKTFSALLAAALPEIDAALAAGEVDAAGTLSRFRRG